MRGARSTGGGEERFLNKEVAERGSVLIQSWHSLKVTDLEPISGSSSILFEICELLFKALFWQSFVGIVPAVGPGGPCLKHSSGFAVVSQ
jgi:hypothetical protein